MKIFDSIDSLREYLIPARKKGTSIGLVPTMGALHKGHLKLIEAAKSQCEITAVSIFVNPTQFNKKEDLEKYPRHLEQDLKTLEDIGCDVIFAPSIEEMYGQNRLLNINVGYFDEYMEGKFRPGHFSGVALVVLKLFNIVLPHMAYFGQKDLQQVALIEKLVSEFNLNIKIVEVPTEREPNGLAMSSRNLRLSKSDQEIASNIYKGLLYLRQLLSEGESVFSALTETKNFYNRVEEFTLEYLEVIDLTDMRPTDKIDNVSYALCVAGDVAGVRLLDNICVRS